jgi:tRNA splicing endonuclease
VILHRASQSVFTAPALYTQSLFRTKTVTHTHKHVYTNTHVLQKRFYTENLLHKNTFIHIHVYTQTLLHTTHKHFYTQPFYTETHLHANTFTHRRFYTETHSHRDAEKYRITGVLYAKEKNMLQMISRKKIEMTCEDSKLKSDEVHRKSFIRRHFDTHTLLLYAHTLLYTNAFADGHTHRREPLWQTHTHMVRRIHTHRQTHTKHMCTYAHTHTFIHKDAFMHLYIGRF